MPWDDDPWGVEHEPLCMHGAPESTCHRCETECVHGNYGPSCPDCRREYG